MPYTRIKAKENYMPKESRPPMLSVQFGTFEKNTLKLTFKSISLGYKHVSI